MVEGETIVLVDEDDPENTTSVVVHRHDKVAGELWLAVPNTTVVFKLSAWDDRCFRGYLGGRALIYEQPPAPAKKKVERTRKAGT